MAQINLVQKRILLSILCLFAAFSLSAFADTEISYPRYIPKQEDQRADIMLSGRTSSLQAVDIALPSKFPSPGMLYSGDFVGNTDGFRWFVSKHYALKTDLEEAEASEALTLLELAYPQLEALFGFRPPRSESLRMTMVLASDRNELKRAMLDDGMFAFELGGVMQEGYAAAYLYAGSDYQTRYILLHEAVHLYQYCLSGDTRSCYGFMLEGLADFFSSHHYDSHKKVLTINVLDRAPIHNHFAQGLWDWSSAGRPAFSQLYAKEDIKRGEAVLLTAFMQSNPSYEQKWRALCSDVVSGVATDKRVIDSLIKKHYGGFAVLDKAFAEWIDNISPSYCLTKRDFDQDGALFISSEPASAEEPATLRLPKCGSQRADFVRDFPLYSDYVISDPPDNLLCKVDVRWSAYATPSSFASVDFAFCHDGILHDDIFLDCVISNSPNPGLAFFEVNGLRDEGMSNRRLSSMLNDWLSVELRLNKKGDGLIVLLLRGEDILASLNAALPNKIKEEDIHKIVPVISASMPGIAFRAYELRNSRHTPEELVPGARFQETAKRDVKEKETFKSQGEAISKWYLIGPFAKEDEGLESDKEVLHPNYVATIDDGTYVIWKEAVMQRSTLFDCPIANVAETLGRQGHDAIAYAYTEIEAEKATDIKLLLGVTDEVEVFVNGASVGKTRGNKDWRCGNLIVEAKLKKGINKVFVRLKHIDGVWLLSGFKCY